MKHSLTTLLRGCVGALFVSLVGCTSDSPNSTVLSSPQVLSAPPELGLSGRLNGVTFFAGTSQNALRNAMLPGANKVEFAAEHPSDNVVLTVPGVRVLFADDWLHNDDHYFVVGAIAANEHFTLYRYEDTDNDGAPDSATETALFSSTAPMYVTAIGRDIAGNAFLLDARCQDIWFAEDTDQDGWPDSIAAQPFARSADFSRLLDAVSLHFVDDDTLETYTFSPGQSIALIHRQEGVRYSDTDSDNVADVETIRPAFSVKPEIYGTPYDGQTSMVLQARVHESGLVGQVWQVDSNGDDVALLGSGTFSGAGYSQEVTVTLSPPLALGQDIAVRFVGRESSQAIVEVVPDWPQALRITPDAIAQNEATAVTIKGMNFTATMTLHLQTTDSSVSSLAFTFVDSETVTATIPAQAPGGYSYILLWGTTDPNEERASVLRASICLAEDLPE